MRPDRVLQQGGGEGEGVDHVHVRASVRSAHDNPFLVLPYLRAQRVGIAIDAADTRAERGLKLVGDDDVEHRLERRLALFRRHLAHRAALVRLGRRAECFFEREVRPIH